jgi:hypothetical protein
MAGLEALASLLGGLGQGAGQGYETGVEAAIKQRQLEQQQQQFEQGHFTDFSGLNPIALKAMGLEGMTGRVNNALIPTIEKAGAAQLAYQQEQERQQRVGNAMQKVAEDQANLAKAPGVAAPALGPGYKAQSVSELARAGARQPEWSALESLLFPKPITLGMGADLVTPEGTKLAEGQPYTPRAADYNAIKEGMIGEGTWGDPNSASFRIELARRMEGQRAKVVGPDSELYRGSAIPGGPATGQTGPSATNYITPPGQQQQQQPQVPQGPSVKRPPTSTAQELKDAATEVTYLNQVQQFARDLRSYMAANQMTGNEGTAKWNRSVLALRNMGEKYDPTGLLETNFPLDEKIAVLRGEAQRLLTMFEKNQGGFRAVSGPQIQAMMTLIHGGRITNPNMAAQLENLAQKGLEEIGVHSRMSGTSGRRDLYGGGAAPASGGWTVTRED